MASSRSISKSSNRDKGKLGGDWTYMAYFDPNAESSQGKILAMKSYELAEKVIKHTSSHEQITHVFVYKCPLTEIQITQFLLCHVFVVFKTNKGYYWSIEKNAEGITMQRSTDESAVKVNYRQTSRNQPSKISLITKGRGVRSVKDLMEMLEKEDELNKEYHYLNSNCKDLAKVVFDYISDSTLATTLCN